MSEGPKCCLVISLPLAEPCQPRLGPLGSHFEIIAKAGKPVHSTKLMYHLICHRFGDLDIMVRDYDLRRRRRDPRAKWPSPFE